MLRDMEREYEGYTKSVKGIMTAAESGAFRKEKIYGPLARLISVDKKYITAIETALGAVNQNIVTETESDAKTAIAYLKEHHLGRATFLPVSTIRAKDKKPVEAKSEKGFLAIASDVVRCEPKYKEIVEHFLGATVICDTIDHAIAMAKHTEHRVRIVTADGDIMQTGGAMTGGSKGKTTGSLSRAGEIAELEQEIKKLSDLSNKEELKLATLETEIGKQKESIRTKNEEISEKKEEEIRITAELSHISDMLRTLSDASRQTETEQADILARIESMKQEQAESETKIAQTEKEKEALETALSQAESELSGLTEQAEAAAQRAAELNLAKNSVLKDMELQNERISALQEEKASRLNRIAEKTNEIQRLRALISNLEAELEKLQAESEKMETSLSDYREKIQNFTEKRSETEKQIREKQEAVKKTQEELFRLTQQHDKLENKSAKFEAETEAIVNYLLEEYQLPYSEAAQRKPAENFQYRQAVSDIKRLKGQIRDLGNINIDAIEEYKDLSERFEFLQTQSEDLKKGKAELENIIREMLEIMQERFSEQFAIINQNFNQVFFELFGGGTAQLSLSDPDNVLESGIEIEAQPPGKKLQSLSLLSGGERAFTAIALLFSILRVRPTPFCILDEIEAALDDINVYRTAEYLRSFSDKTQFIIITHRRGTMEAANVLYGVTMQERGVSKLLSLNIDEMDKK